MAKWLMKKKIAIFLIVAMVFSIFPGSLGFFPKKAYADPLPDGTQTFSGYNFSGGVGTSPDGFFKLTASKAGETTNLLRADQFGAYIDENITGTTEESYLEVSVNGSLGSFTLGNLSVGEYLNSNMSSQNTYFANVTVKGYSGTTEVFATIPYTSASASFEENYPINYSVAAGKQITSFRVYYTKDAQTVHQAFNLVSFTIGNASTEAPKVAPTITTQPSSQTVAEGQGASFSVAASGDQPFSYQWKKNGVNIVGATSSSYSIPSVQVSDAGDYTVVVTNGGGSATSNAATLTVNPGTIPVTGITVRGESSASTITTNGGTLQMEAVFHQTMLQIKKLLGQ